MSKPAARVGDMHTCPMSDGPKPHVGGPILPSGVPTVLIGGMPAATITNQCVCVSPAPDVIAKGSLGVLIGGGKMAARVGDSTVHGGVIINGCPSVLIGDLSTAQVLIVLNNVLAQINSGNGTINCGNIIDGVKDFIEGNGVTTVSTLSDGSWNQINTRLGTNLNWNSPTSFNNIFQDLNQKGSGNMTLIGVNYNSNPPNSHVIIAANVDGQVGIMEGQGGNGFITNPTVANNLYNSSGNSTVVSDPIP